MVINNLPYDDVLIEMLIIFDNIYIYDLLSVVDGKLKFINKNLLLLILILTKISKEVFSFLLLVYYRVRFKQILVKIKGVNRKKDGI